MKYLRRLAGITVCLVIVFMAAALFQYQAGEEYEFLPQQMEYTCNEGWTMAVLDKEEDASGEELLSHDRIKELFADAKKAGLCREVSLPFQGKSQAFETAVFQNTLAPDFAGLTMNFACSEAVLRVVLDDEIIYEHTHLDDEISGHNQTNQNFIDIPHVMEKGELWIEMVSPSQDEAAMLGEVKVVTRDKVVISVVGSSISDIGCCLLILLMAIIMFVLALIRRYTGQPPRGEMYLALMGLSAGIYCFIGTDTLSIFYNLQEAYEMQEYLLLLSPLFLTLYFERNLHQAFPRRFGAVLGLVIFNAAVQVVLQIAGIIQMQDMVTISAAAAGIACIAAIVSLIQYDYRNRSYKTVLWVLSVLVLLAGEIANVIVNRFSENERVNLAVQYSMAVFAVMMAVMHTFQISKEYRSGAEERVKETEQRNMQLAQAKKDADAARAEAQAANEAKGKFLAHMSHEIRTPINAVLGMDEMILRESGEPQIREYAMDIYTAGQTLLSLINDILDFSKIESGKMEIVPAEYDFSSMIHDLLNMASQRAREKKSLRLEAEISHDIPSRLYGDDVRIRQVLTNILTNAVKYTPKGTVWLRVRISTMEQDSVRLFFEVEDTGIGIKKEDLPKLSAEFERIEEERNRSIEGTGLGMSITMQLLDLMGSRLSAESEYGKGSRFYFELEQGIMDHTPVGDFESRVRRMSEDYISSAGFLAPDVKILSVDDNEVNRKVLRSLLKQTRIQVTDAAGGAECLELVQKNHYDLILLDHMMPEMDGIETLHRMKQLHDYPCEHTPVVVLTANAVSGAKEKYLSEGFDDFLSKPVVPQKLENMIRKMVPEHLILEKTDSENQTASSQQGGFGQPADASSQPDVLGQSADVSSQQGGFGQPADVSRAAENAADMLDNLPQTDGLDWQYAWMHLPDMELLEFTVKEFYAQIDSAAQLLEQFFEKADEPQYLNQYRIQVHAMKSLAASVGILPLSGAAKILEYAARDGRTDIVKAVTPAFLEEWRSYRYKLKGVFGIGTETKKEITDASVILALVEMVRISMQEMDIDQADSLMRQLQEYAFSDETKEAVQKLAQAVTNLDAQEADQAAGIIIKQMGETV